MPEARIYQNYQQLKAWNDDNFMVPARGDALFFDQYLSRLNLSGENVLEVGFGNGGFLGWAKRRGAILHGTEIQPPAIEKARASGVTLLPADIGEAGSSLAGAMLVVAAIDVLEHMTFDQIEAFLVAASTMLKPGGLILLRFPNGQSPLSLRLQYADRTHVSIVSIPIVSQMAFGLPLVIDYAGPPRPVTPPRLIGRISQHVQNILRAAADGLIRSAYGDVPMYANAVMVFRRA